MRFPLRAVALAAALCGATTTFATAGPLDPPPQCTDVASPFDPTCVPGAAVAHNARQVCDYAFVPGCDLTAFTRPGYAVDADPSPRRPYQWKVGALHEHSGYSDGDIDSVPRDYFTAARTGVNGDGSGLQLDFLFSSEHSDNAQITPTTNQACLTGPQQAATCAHLDDNSFYWKWPATLRQAQESSTSDFTAMRGFEWTNDFYNHMNVYFSTNFRNVKIDGSYLALERMWGWLQQPVDQGGGADGLVTFNHPGSNPKLSPFDGDLPHAELLGENTALDNWNEVAYVPEVDDRVVGMEINGGEDIEWFIRALTNGWHIGPVAAEDEHGRRWASNDQHKTLVLTRGSTPQDYYWAMANRRTAAVHADLLGGAPGTPAIAPVIDFTADGRHLLGSIVRTAARHHTLRVAASGLPTGARVALIGSEAGQAAPVQLGTVGADGTIDAKRRVVTDGDDWWFAIVCNTASETACGSDQNYSAVTAPIWFE